MKIGFQPTKLIPLLLLMIVTACNAGTFIRLNQLGFLPGDSKTAVILSSSDLSGSKFYVKDSGGKTVLDGAVTASIGQYGNFNYVHRIDFSVLRAKGTYKVEVNSESSVPFEISDKLYNSLAPTLLQFFKVQRCGYTNPLLHKTCHVADATKIIENGQELDKKHDVTGGWHDAGDYTKFLNTTAFATYMMLFSYEFDPEKFGFDNDHNSVPDILEEAKIGLDWLLRASYEKNKFIVQVQDEDDKNVGWRLPSGDPLAFDRPGFVGIGKNLIGIYVATMAIGYRIWRDEIKYQEFADQLLTAAENYYSLRNQVPDIDEHGTGEYIDKSYAGKLGLGAVEMYISTNRPALLDDAERYALQAGSDYWWSWGDINSLVDYRLAKYDKSFADFIEKNLEHFKETSDSTLFGRAAGLTWGTNHAMMGAALQSILYEKVTGNTKYRNMASLQRDYVLGLNPWGVSFIYNVGEVYTEHFHHQVAYFNNGKLPGGFAAGPITREIFKEYKIEPVEPDRFSMFQSDSMIYIDDRIDYISNEPTIAANATAIFVMGYFSGK